MASRLYRLRPTRLNGRRADSWAKDALAGTRRAGLIAKILKIRVRIDRTAALYEWQERDNRVAIIHGEP